MPGRRDASRAGHPAGSQLLPPRPRLCPRQHCHLLLTGTRSRGAARSAAHLQPARVLAQRYPPSLGRFLTPELLQQYHGSSACQGPPLAPVEGYSFAWFSVRLFPLCIKRLLSFCTLGSSLTAGKAPCAACDRSMR